jgi:dynamin 1-like protein
MMASVQNTIDALGDPVDSQTSSALGSTLLRLISKYCSNISNSLDGRSKPVAGNNNTIETSELFGGARISYIFNEIFGKKLKALDPLDGLDDDDIRTAIANANGTRPSLFIPEISFDLLVRRQIARLEQPGTSIFLY